MLNIYKLIIVVVHVVHVVQVVVDRNDRPRKLSLASPDKFKVRKNSSVSFAVQASAIGNKEEDMSVITFSSSSDEETASHML